MKKKQEERKIEKIKSEKLSAYVDSHPLFEDITFETERGTLTLVYGKRGSGKSAFLRSIARLNEEIYQEVRYHGKLLFDEMNALELPESEIRRHVTYFDTNFLESMDHLKFIDLIHLSLGNIKFDIDEYASVLDDFGLLKALVKREKTPLSYFYFLEKIEALLFISTLKNSSVLIFDCILDHLDDSHVSDATKLIKTLSEEKIVLLSTRSLVRFLSVSDLLLILDGGKIVYDGDPRRYVVGGI